MYCDQQGLHFINNQTFTAEDLWSDGIHLRINNDGKNTGVNKLTNSFKEALSR